MTLSSAGTRPILPSKRVDDHRIALLVPVGIDIIEIGAAGHAEAGDEAAALRIALRGQRHDERRPQLLERIVEGGDRGLLGVALAPGVFAEAPGDLDLARHPASAAV